MKRLLPLLTLVLPFSAHGAIDALRFEKELVVEACEDPTQLDLAADGRVFWVERAGAVKVWSPATGQTTLLGMFPSLATGDAGALGLALSPDFSQSGHLYLFRIPKDEPKTLVVSRHTLKDGKLDPASEKRLLEIALSQGPTQSHCGGGLAFDGAGNLLIGMGDNIGPQDLPAVNARDAGLDSRGTAANSMELRGKILRITPRPDGTYAIPAGNLFADPAVGRPEIFAFGVRNPFRVAADPVAGWVTWGDVGGNVNTKLNLGPEGFDEINVTREPGFFGWPFCSGPNAPWRPFDPETKAPTGPFFDPLHVVNDSPRNTGLKELPPARPAAFWFTSTASAAWPFAGSGGRSVTGGVFYRPGPAAGEKRLPDELKGSLIFGEWMRNWLAVAALREDGTFASAGPLAPHLRFRRPTDFKIGPDGALYVAEFGDRWTGNQASQITRLVYRRGNRAPVAGLTASATSGALPLRVNLSAATSRDPDADGPLSYEWDLGDGRKLTGVETVAEFAREGAFTVTLRVTDPQGLVSTASLPVMAGNSSPEVRFTEPRDGGFYEPGKPLAWSLAVTDAEDGSVPPEKVSARLELRARAAADSQTDVPPGLALMRGTTCFACHHATEKSAGPSYLSVAEKYAGDAAAPDRLARKILSGGSGVWGELPMPPHPQHTLAQAGQMVAWVLSLKRTSGNEPVTGLAGSFPVPAVKNSWGQIESGVAALSAAATDQGRGLLPPQRGTAEVVLHARRQRAALYDRGENTTAQDNLDQGGLVARVSPGGWFAFDRLRLSQIGSVRLQAWPQTSGTLRIVVRRGGPAGPELASVSVPGGPSGGKPREINLPFAAPVADGLPESLVLTVEGGPDALLEVMWIEFRDKP